MSHRHIETRDQYRFFTRIPTRWSDNDMLGHINNVIYYRFFEVVVVDYIMNQANIDFKTDPVIPFAAESLCRFRKPISFPDVVEGALRIDKLGNTSVRYGIALFVAGEVEAVAHGHWVHVFVDRENQRPVAIPAHTRAAFEAT